jgi:hypothetical protein
MIEGHPPEGTRIRTLKELYATSGLTLPAGTGGVLLQPVASDSPGSRDDLFVARLDGDVVLQVRRDDVEKAEGSP